MKNNFMSKLHGAFKSGEKGSKIEAASFHDSGSTEYSTESAERDDDDDQGLDDSQHTQIETHYIRLSGEKAYDLKIEHFDDMI